MKLIERGDDDFDAKDGRLTVQLSRGEDGAWMFWGVVFRDQQFGGTQNIGPGAFRDWLDAQEGDRS